MSPSTTRGLSGTWAGTIGDPTSGTSLRLTWQITESGNTLAGPATLVKPVNNFPASGTLEGTRSGTDLTLIYRAPAGAVAAFPSCAITGTGNAVVSANAISGTLTLTFTFCAGTGLEPPNTGQFTLTRQ